MANYIAWFGKKRERLLDCEREFLSLLRGESDSTKVAKAADAVRAAQIRALKSKRAQLPPAEKSAIAVAHLKREIEFWQKLSSRQIIDGYRSGKLKGHRSTAV
jgi:hypothetical protein